MLLRIIRPCSDQRVYYFAFGANLSPDILRLRRIGVYETFDYVLENAVLNFSQRGFYKHHGFASADASVGDCVYGKMYLIRQSDAKRMDYFEGVPFLKAHAKIVQQVQGKPFYFYRSQTPLNDLKPTQQYLNYLTNAYRNMDIVPSHGWKIGRRLRLTLFEWCPYLTPLTHYDVKIQITNVWCKSPLLCNDGALVARCHS